MTPTLVLQLPLPYYALHAPQVSSNLRHLMCQFSATIVSLGTTQHVLVYPTNNSLIYHLTPNGFAKTAVAFLISGRLSRFNVTGEMKTLYLPFNQRLRQ